LQQLPVKNIFAGASLFDGFVNSLQARHSRERGSPEVIDFPGFPLSRE